MRKRVRSGFLSLLFALAAFGQEAPPPPPDARYFLFGMKQAFEASDRAAYLAHFAAGLRDLEGSVYDSLKKESGMTGTAFYPAKNSIEEKEGSALYVQAVFQNDLEALFETWKIEWSREDGRLVIGAKTVIGNPAIFLKLMIPSDRVERAARVEIRHADLVATFEDAWVFYDNIPDRETGLIILGDGRLQFSPSSETESHQLFLRFKSGTLDQPVTSAYLRFSPSFFEDRITVTPAAGPPAGPCPPAEAEKARLLFRRHYGGSFTIDNPAVGTRLSALPQGEQAVFEFGTGSRRGFGFGYSPFSEEEVHFWSRSPDELLCLYSPRRPGDAEGERRMFLSFGEKADVLRCDIDLDFQPGRRFLQARARLELSALAEGLDNMRFDFNPALDVLKVYDAGGQELFFVQDKVQNMLYVRFLRPLAKDETTTLEVYYRGFLAPPPPLSDVLPAGVSSAGVDFREDGDLYTPTANWYPVAAAGDYFLARLRVSLPPGYRCVANGELVGEESIEEVRRVLSLEKVGNRLLVFETRKPVKGLAFIVGRFREAASDPDPAPPPVNVLFTDSVRNLPGTMAAEARSIVRLFEKIFGPFPYEKLTVVQRVAATTGGHSPASFVVLNEPRTGVTPPGVPDFGSPVDLPGYRELFLAHEIAHQWWGHAVTGSTYHDLWLSEGLSQYAAVRYLKSKYGEETLPSLLKKNVAWTERKAKYGPISLGARLSYLDFDAFQAILYGKSCLVLFLLSDLIGEDALDRGLRAFLAAAAFRPARTAEFIRALEEAAGRPLGDFFRGWVYSHLLPEASVSFQVLKEGEGYELRVNVRQTGRPMVFPLHVTWREDDRTVRRVLDVDSETEFFSFKTAVKPSRFKADPDGILPGTIR